MEFVINNFTQLSFTSRVASGKSKKGGASEESHTVTSRGVPLKLP